MSGTPSGAVSGGFSRGQIVQEIGWDEDVDDALREEIERATGEALVPEQRSSLCDGTIIWWREDDGSAEDLTDTLVDALTNLEDGGVVWVLTPKAGRSGHVVPADITEAANVAGMHATSTTTVGEDWSGTRVETRGRQR